MSARGPRAGLASPQAEEHSIKVASFNFGGAAHGFRLESEESIINYQRRLPMEIAAMFKGRDVLGINLAPDTAEIELYRQIK